MNTASLELCRELYELSGWTPPSASSKYSGNDVIEWGEGLYRDQYPAYDLGYLLRKLPYALEAIPGKYSSTSLLIYKRKDSWRMTYNHRTDLGVSADSPEDAACMLAIELFKKGELTKQ